MVILLQLPAKIWSGWDQYEGVMAIWSSWNDTKAAGDENAMVQIHVRQRCYTFKWEIFNVNLHYAETCHAVQNVTEIDLAITRVHSRPLYQKQN